MLFRSAFARESISGNGAITQIGFLLFVSYSIRILRTACFREGNNQTSHFDVRKSYFIYITRSCRNTFKINETINLAYEKSDSLAALILQSKALFP